MQNEEDAAGRKAGHEYHEDRHTLRTYHQSPSEASTTTYEYQTIKENTPAPHLPDRDGQRYRGGWTRVLGVKQAAEAGSQSWWRQTESFTGNIQNKSARQLYLYKFGNSNSNEPVRESLPLPPPSSYHALPQGGQVGRSTKGEEGGRQRATEFYMRAKIATGT